MTDAPENPDDLLQKILKSTNDTVKSAKPELPDSTPPRTNSSAPKKSKTGKRKPKGSKKATPVVVVKRKRKKSGATYKFSQTTTPVTAQRYYDMQAKLDITMGAVLAKAIDALEKSESKK